MSEPQHNTAEALAELQNESTIWAIEPAQHAAYIRALRESGPAAVVAARPTTAGRKASGSVAVLPIMGLISYRPNILTMLFGGTVLTDWQGQFADLVRAKNVSSILIPIASGGGFAEGVHETAVQIRAAGRVKPIIGMADPHAGSAAYWLGSAATRFFMLGSGSVGSVGVFSTHIDLTEARKKEGIAITYVSSTAEKVELSPELALTKSAKVYLQQQVGIVYSQFLRDVAEGRRTTSEQVAATYDPGRMVDSIAAKRAGMVDGVVDSFGQVMQEAVGLENNRREVRLRREELVVHCGGELEYARIGREIEADRAAEDRRWKAEDAKRAKWLAAEERELQDAGLIDFPDLPPDPPKRPRGGPVVVSSTGGTSTVNGQPAAKLDYERIATKICREGRVETIEWQPPGVTSGKAWPAERKIRVPRPTDVDRLGTLAHEVGHCVFAHKSQLPSWRVEYEACLFAEKELYFHGVPISSKTKSFHRTYVAQEVDKAVAVNPATLDLDQEVVEFCGEHLTARTRKWLESKGRLVPA